MGSFAQPTRLPTSHDWVAEQANRKGQRAATEGSSSSANPYSRTSQANLHEQWSNGFQSRRRIREPRQNAGGDLFNRP